MLMGRLPFGAGQHEEHLLTPYLTYLYTAYVRPAIVNLTSSWCPAQIERLEEPKQTYHPRAEP